MKNCKLVLLVLMGLLSSARGEMVLLVSEYNTGNIRAFRPADGQEITGSFVTHYQPVGGVATGTDGITMRNGHLYVTRANGQVFQRDLQGVGFSLFANLGSIGVNNLLDISTSGNHLWMTRMESAILYRVGFENPAAISTYSPPPAASFQGFDGVRVGPDGRVYVVEVSTGHLRFFNPGTVTWGTFLTNNLGGTASQLEFGTDGRVFVSRTISGQARIYAYTLQTAGNWAGGLNPTATLIGSFGSTGIATGIRIGPDGRLYANAYDAGEVWRSNVGITEMEATRFLTGLNSPASLYFTWLRPIPPRVSHVSDGATSRIHLEETESYRRYRLQSRDNLLVPDPDTAEGWTDRSNWVFLSSGQGFILPQPLSGSSRFYRILMD